MSDSKIYPVPAKDHVMIDMDKADLHHKITITLSDISGRKLEDKIIRRDQLPYRLDVSSLNSGIYFLKICSGEKATARKIVH